MARRKSEVYWEERSVEAKLAGIADAEAYAKRLAKAYEDAARAMDDELAKWYGRYAKAEGITIEQARMMIRGSDFSAFRRDVREYINMGRTLPYSDEWAEELERLSSEYHVTRYEALIAQLRQRIEMIYAMQKGNLDDVLADIYTDQCHRMAFDLQNFTGVYTHFEAVSTDAAKLVLSHPWATDGKIYSTRIWEHQKKLIGEVETILSRGLLTGDSYDNMAKQLQKAMQTSAFNANRLITTEAAYFQEQARQNTMDALGVDKRQIFATLDTKTCEHCGRLDLKVIDKADCTPGVTVPPFHVFCRCTHGPYYDDEFSRQFDKRAYRDPETGKTMTAEMMSYDEWKKKYLITEKEASHKGRYRDTEIARSVIESPDYGRRISALDESKAIKKIIKKQAVAMLNHRSGTLFEDLTYINTKTNQYITRTDFDHERGVAPSDRMKKMVLNSEKRTIIAMHNHPQSSMPSKKDIENAIRYKYGIIVCHDGNIIKYTVGDKPDVVLYKIAMDTLNENGYNKNNIKTFIETVEEYNVNIELL